MIKIILKINSIAARNISSIWVLFALMILSSYDIIAQSNAPYLSNIEIARLSRPINPGVWAKSTTKLVTGNTDGSVSFYESSAVLSTAGNTDFSLPTLVSKQISSNVVRDVSLALNLASGLSGDEFIALTDDQIIFLNLNLTTSTVTQTIVFNSISAIASGKFKQAKVVDLDGDAFYDLVFLYTDPNGNNPQLKLYTNSSKTINDPTKFTLLNTITLETSSYEVGELIAQKKILSTSNTYSSFKVYAAPSFAPVSDIVLPTNYQILSYKIQDINSNNLNDLIVLAKNTIDNSISLLTLLNNNLGTNGASGWVFTSLPTSYSYSTFSIGDIQGSTGGGFNVITNPILYQKSPLNTPIAILGDKYDVVNGDDFLVQQGTANNYYFSLYRSVNYITNASSTSLCTSKTLEYTATPIPGAKYEIVSQNTAIPAVVLTTNQDYYKQVLISNLIKNSAGTYQLKIYSPLDNNLQILAYTQTYTVENSPVVSFSLTNDYLCPGKTLTVTDNSYSTDTNRKLLNLQVNWDVSDISTSQTFTFTANTQTSTFVSAYSQYFKSQVYTLSVQVTDDNTSTPGLQCKAIAQRVITIYPTPHPDFDLSSQCFDKATIEFVDNSKFDVGAMADYGVVWTFGDNNASLSNPNSLENKIALHHYDFTGNYTVTLEVTTTDNGCKLSKSATIQIVSSPLTPVASFGVVSPTILCSNLPISFSNPQVTNPSYGIVDKVYYYFNWTSGQNDPDQTVSATNLGVAVNHSYDKINDNLVGVTKSVKRTIRFKGGCMTDFTIPVALLSVPNTTFESYKPVCSNDQYFLLLARELTGFVGFWTYSEPHDSKEQWVFDPPQRSVGDNVFWAKFTSVAGCEDKATYTVTVFQAPKVVFKPIADFCQNIAPFALPVSEANSLLGFWTFSDKKIRDNAILYPDSFTKRADYKIWAKYTVRYQKNGISVNCIDSAQQIFQVLKKPNFTLVSERNLQGRKGMREHLMEMVLMIFGNLGL